MGLYNSDIASVDASTVTFDIGQPWTVSRGVWAAIPGSSPPRVGDYWGIEVSSVSALLRGERPSRVIRTTDYLDGVNDALGAYGLSQ